MGIDQGQLLDVKLLYRAVLDRRGDDWPSDPVAGKPDATFIDEDGRVVFVYRRPVVTGYSLLPGRRLERVAVTGSVVARAVTDATGRLVERTIKGRGNPAWN
jgi:hypothetical protein